MHRFGRSAQQRLKDRWGGGFILATILALLAAWYVGDSLGNWINNNNTTADGGTGTKKTAKTGNNAMPIAVEPQEFKMHFVQVGAFLSGKNARDMVEKVSTEGYNAMVAPKNKSGFLAVWVGPFMDSAEADAAKAKLTEAGMKPVVVNKTVAYNTNAVPAAATGNKSTDVQAVMGALNMYIHEVAMWMEMRGQNMSADTTTIAAHGRELTDLAAALAGEKDPQMQALATMANMAASNATAFNEVAGAETGDQPFQAAMTEYLGLVDQYNAFQAKGK